jgi:NHL repeat
MLDRRQGTADDRHPGQTGALHERGAVPPLHPHRALAQGRNLRLGRLRQCLRPQIHQNLGEPGTDPGQFYIVHNIATDADGFVYVADRENHRVQVFDGNGKYETPWNNLHRPCALYCCGGKQRNFVIGELGPGMPVNRKVPNLGPRLTIVDAKGKRIARLGGENGPGLEAGKFLAPHGIALDSTGDIYVGEVGVTDWKTSFPDTPMPTEVGVVRCLQKLEKI